MKDGHYIINITLWPVLLFLISGAVASLRSIQPEIKSEKPAQVQQDMKTKTGVKGGFNNLSLKMKKKIAASTFLVFLASSRDASASRSTILK